MIKCRFAFTRLDQMILYTEIYIVDVNNNDGARVRTMNDRCDFSEIKEINRNEKENAVKKKSRS